MGKQLSQDNRRKLFYQIQFGAYSILVALIPSFAQNKPILYNDMVILIRHITKALFLDFSFFFLNGMK